MIITSSLKDVMVLHKLGYNAIAPQSENSSFPKNLKEDLEKRFDNIVLFFDADDPGVAAARDFCSRTGYRWFTIPDRYHSKDISDCVTAHGIHRVQRIIKRRLARTFRVDEIPF